MTYECCSRCRAIFFWLHLSQHNPHCLGCDYGFMPYFHRFLGHCTPLELGETPRAEAVNPHSILRIVGS